MKFSEWKIWYRELPWAKKWFVILILIRPIIDPFFFLKRVEVYYSPLNILALLTIIFIVLSLNSKYLQNKKRSMTDFYFFIWGVFIIINSSILVIVSPTINNIQNTSKSILPLFLYSYTKRFIEDERDLEGIFFTFLIAAIFPFFTLCYEYLVGPIDPQILSGARGGGTRFVGLYADIFNYAIYIISVILFILYTILKRRESKSLTMTQKKIFLLFLFVILGLIAIKHVATWSVFIMLIGLFTLFQFTNLRGWVVGLVFIFLFLPFLGQYIYESQIHPLVKKELRVAEGEEGVERSFNGRMTRWIKYTGVWSDTPLYIKLFGIGPSGLHEATAMISGHMHNDFLRILFLTGLWGLTFYFIFLFSVLIKSFKKRLHHKFLIISSVFIIFLYSVSAIPTFYPNLLYLVYAIFAYASLKEPLNETQKEGRYPWQAAAAVRGPGNRYRNYSKFPVKRKI